MTFLFSIYYLNNYIIEMSNLYPLGSIGNNTTENRLRNDKVMSVDREMNKRVINNEYQMCLNEDLRKKMRKSFSHNSNLNKLKVKTEHDCLENTNAKSIFQESTKPFTNFESNKNNSDFTNTNKISNKISSKQINKIHNKFCEKLHNEDFPSAKEGDLNEFYNNENRLEFSFYMDPIKERDVSYLFSSSKKATINTKIIKPNSLESNKVDKSMIKEDFSISSINSIPSIDISEIAERFYSNKYKINDKINEQTNISGGLKSKKSQSSDIIFNRATKNYIENILSTRELSQLTSDNEIRKIFKRTKSQSFLSISNKLFFANNSSISKQPKTTTNFHHNKNDNINLLGNILKNHNRYLDNNKWEITVNNHGNEVISDIYSNSKFNSEDKSRIFFYFSQGLLFR